MPPFLRRSVPPLATCVAIGINVAVAVVQFSVVDTRTLREYTLSPDAVIYRGEYYRIVTSAFLHSGALHLGVNMASMATIGQSLEERFGTARLAAWLVVATFLSGTVHCAIALLDRRYMVQHSLGFSGVLFALIVGESWRSTASRSLFGMVVVPARFYPLAALVAIQVVLPNVSFLGHLGGLLAGALEYYGLLSCLLPSPALSARLDARVVASCDPYYVPAPSEAPETGRPADALRDAWRLARHLISFAASFVGLAACATRVSTACARTCATRRHVGGQQPRDDDDDDDEDLEARVPMMPQEKTISSSKKRGETEPGAHTPTISI
ncbi:hypothetical protein CTAYLR_001219 [Chrysophaeum taylorii]|uniref:Peptidase S54 rhomboid domain-containing protein n=1 Tax=Chrysophaeum taylorii TaxID=2483200 RepID=A0AAD7UCI9_9STRA|nr:hypothetical protein CTAYLR_001219 [Chrysophaeum taylorii]